MNSSPTMTFESAWTDLGERLQRGITTLETMSYEPRRAAKLEGLQEAHYIYETIARDLFPDPDFPRGGLFGWQWHEFTSRVLAQYLRALDEHRGDFATGLALALEYQRGFAPEIDAPTLQVLLARAGGRA